MASDSLIQAFVEDSLARLAEARRALPSDEPEAGRARVRELAHALKGAAGMFGLMDATDLAKVVEARHREGKDFDRSLAIAALYALERLIRDREPPAETLVELLRGAS